MSLRDLVLNMNTAPADNTNVYQIPRYESPMFPRVDANVRTPGLSQPPKPKNLFEKKQWDRMAEEDRLQAKKLSDNYNTRQDNQKLIKGFKNVADNYIEAPAGLANAAMDILEGTADTKISQEVRDLVVLMAESGDLILSGGKGLATTAGGGMFMMLKKEPSSPANVRKLVDMLDEQINALAKVRVPNQMNPNQFLNAVDAVEEQGIPFARTFEQKYMNNRYSPNTHLSGTSSNHIGLSGASGEIALSKNQAAPPLLTEFYDVGPSAKSHFGVGPGQQYLEGHGEVALSNMEARRIVDWPRPKGMPDNSLYYLPAGGVVNLSDLSADDVMDINKHYKDLMAGSSLSEIVRAIDKTPLVKGRPEYVTKNGVILPDFSISHPFYSLNSFDDYAKAGGLFRRDRPNLIEGLGGEGIYDKSVIDNTLEYLGVDGVNKMSKMEKNLLFSDLVPKNLSKLEKSRSPVKREMVNQILSGNVRPDGYLPETISDALYDNIFKKEFDLELMRPNVWSAQDVIDIPTETRNSVRTNALMRYLLEDKPSIFVDPWAERLKPFR